MDISSCNRQIISYLGNFAEAFLQTDVTQILLTKARKSQPTVSDEIYHGVVDNDYYSAVIMLVVCCPRP